MAAAYEPEVIANVYVVANALVADAAVAAVVLVFDGDEAIFVDCVSGERWPVDAAIVVASCVGGDAFVVDVAAAVGRHSANVADVATKSAGAVAEHDCGDVDSGVYDCAYVPAVVVAAVAAVVVAVE